MRYNVGAIQRESKERLSQDLAICEADGVCEETKSYLCDSEHAILINDCRWVKLTVPLNLALIHENEGAYDKEMENVEKRMDLGFLREDERWLLEIETDELRDAVRGMKRKQQDLIRALLECKKKTEAAEVLGIKSSALSGRISRVQHYLERTLPPETLSTLTRGRNKKTRIRK